MKISNDGDISIEKKDKSAFKFAVFFICVVGLIFVFNPFVVVNAGERGVIKEFGNVQDEVWDEGLHIKVPVRDQIAIMNVKTLKYEVGASAASKDLQITTTTVAVNYHIVPELSNELYQQVGLSYEAKIIDPAIQEVVKASTAKYNAEELITKRPLVKDSIESGLKEKMLERGIVIETVYITNFDFSSEFNAAIEAKVKAQQMALQAENDLIRIEVEARQKVTQATAEAEAIRLIEEQLSKSPQYVQYLAVVKWNGELPKVTGDSIPLITVDVN